MKALLVIDMQKVSFTPQTPRYDSERVIDIINSLAQGFRERGEKVIFIQHDGSKQNFCMPGSEEWEILSSLAINPIDLIVSKTANDAFYNTGLKETLLQLGVNQLVITGCATDFCVDSTIKSALVNDFNVSIIANGHTTADRPTLNAQQVIKHYNWIWSEMTPTQGRIEVIDYDTYLRSEAGL